MFDIFDSFWGRVGVVIFILIIMGLADFFYFYHSPKKASNCFLT